MISAKDKTKILEIAKRYKAKRVLLFGSSADPQKEANDIDLGVDGVPAGNFFKFYGDLIFSVSKPIDLIDLSKKSKFVQMIRREGIPLYG